MPPRNTRRMRDYFTSMIIVNLTFATVMSWSRHNVVVLLYAGAGMIVFTIWFTWTMWFVMDDY